MGIANRTESVKAIAFILCFFVGIQCYAQRQDQVFQEYRIDEFPFQEKQAKVVFPNVEANGNWIWRARFWGHEPQTDKALLDTGFHLVYVDVADLFGNEKAIALWDAFYMYCREKYDLNEKVVLEGMSRGGLIIYNWAAQNTEKVVCIYADAPVCDIKSWPGGLYKGIGSEKAWKTCLKAHGLDDKTVLGYKGIPLFTSMKVAEAGIPVLHVCGDSDEVVPYEENTGKLKDLFESAGGSIQILLKKGIGHHPHSLTDPKPIVEFILGNASLDSRK